MDLIDLSLIVVKGPHGYAVSAECPLSGEAGPVQISESEIEKLVYAGRVFAAGLTVSSDQAAEIGRLLYSRFFRDGLGDLYQRSRAVAQARHSALRFLIKLGDALELHEIPWELLHDGSDFLALTPQTPIARYLRQLNPVNPLEIKPPLRFLFTTACPNDQDPLDLAKEERLIRSAMEGLRDQVELVVERHVTLDTLIHLFSRAEHLERPFHLWHHCGHGGMLEGAEPVFVLVLENHRHESEDVSVAQLRNLIRACPELRMATLNVCHGASAVGLASALAKLNVPAVMGFRGEIPDQAALEFIKSFYEALIYEPADVAMAKARVSLAVRDDRSLDWLMPVLFLRTTRPFLLSRKTKDDIKAHGAASRPPAGARATITFQDHGQVQNQVNIGVVNAGDPLPSSSDLTVNFKSNSRKKGKLVQIGQINSPADESGPYFASIQKMVQSLLSDLQDDE